MKLQIAIFLFIIITACNPDKAAKGLDANAQNGSSTNVPVEQINVKQEETTETDQRRSWQKPELVLQKLGDLKGSVVADIGAGTGYFSFRLMRRAKKVIAVDIDPLMLKFIDALKETLSKDLQTKLETRLATPDSPNLTAEEVDMILIVNTFAYIENGLDYLKNLKAHLKPGGKIAILDFKMKRMDINAPPFSERILLHEVEELMYQAGLTNISTDDTTLDYQYIIIGEIE